VGLRFRENLAWTYRADARRLSGFSIARAAKQGYLTVGDNRGRVIVESRSDSGPYVTLLADVREVHEGTFYILAGDWFAWASLAVLAAALIRMLLELSPKRGPKAPKRLALWPIFRFVCWRLRCRAVVRPSERRSGRPSAKLRAGKPDRGLQSAAPLSSAGMGKQDEADWNTAVGFYAEHFGTRRQHGDDQLIQINDDLAEQPDTGAYLNPAGLPPEMASVLQSAGVIYRKYWWAPHNESNANWIASQKERVQDLGPKLASAMTKDMHQQWPAAPIRVDVCYYVVDLGYAFTTTSPSHTTFSSLDPSDQDLSRFELFFHEASHTFADVTMNALSAEGRTQNRDVGDLWHAVLFYTSGVELRRLLPAPEQASFSPYAFRYGVYAGGNWPT